MKNAILFILEQLESLTPQHRGQIAKLAAEVRGETKPAKPAKPATAAEEKAAAK